jgi:hypothetical protein
MKDDIWPDSCDLVSQPSAVSNVPEDDFRAILA